MFTVWRIGNFKSIDRLIDLRLSPLTVLAGSNSSGKSTLIQSILMMTQTILVDPQRPTMVLNGPLIQLGSTTDILHAGNATKPLYLGFSFLSGSKGGLLFRVESVLRRRPYSSSEDNEEPGTLELDQSTITFNRRLSGRHQSCTVKAIDKRIHRERSEAMSGELRERVESGAFDYQFEAFPVRPLSETWREEVEGVEVKGILPRRILVGYDSELRKLDEDVQWLADHLASASTPSGTRTFSPLLRKVLQEMKVRAETSRQVSSFLREHRSPRLESDTLFRFLYESLFQEDVGYLAQDYGRRLSSARDAYFRKIRQEGYRQLPNSTTYELRLLPGEYTEIVDDIRRIISESVYYLGPLRESPKILFTIAPHSNRIDLGVRGEYTAEILHRFRNKQIRYPLPPDNRVGTSYKVGRLIEAVVTWLQHMGLVTELQIRETPKVGYSLHLQNKNLSKELDLTSVGVGVSQVLPTLVHALIAPENSVLLYEQPELHLHPKVQSILGDFFLGISNLGKQCIVETHSEHIVNRLRRRIVEAPDDRLTRHVGVFFVEKKEACSSFLPIEINEFGVIPSWPDGFFDEVEDEASIILRLQLEKRSRRRDDANSNTKQSEGLP